MLAAMEPPELGGRILVVDDEPDILDGLKSFLQSRLDVEVLTAGSGANALEELRRTTVDLVMSDYKMPNMDGLVFLAQAHKLRPDAVRIMMTAYADLDLAIKAVNEASILHFFTKPIEPDHLVEVIGAVLRAQVATRQRDEALKRSLEMMRRRKR